MDGNTPPQPAIERFGPSLIILSFLGSIFALGFNVLSNPGFLGGFAVMILQIGMACGVGGGIGVGMGELVLRSELCAQSAIRFLRLGMWFPFFVAWSAPTWWIRWGEVLQAPFWAERTLRVVIAISPAVMFAACYYHLSARHTLRLNRRAALITVLTWVLLHALLFSFLGQVLLFRDGWHWFPYPGQEWLTRPSATVLLLGGFLFVLHRITGSGF